MSNMTHRCICIWPVITTGTWRRWCRREIEFLATVTKLCHTIPIPAPPPPPPLPLYSSDVVGAFICKAQNYCRKFCIHTVCYFSNWYYFLLPYYNSIVTTPVHWNSHSPLHTIKLVYCNNHPHKHKLIYTKKYIVN